MHCQTHRDAIVNLIKRDALLKYMEFVVQPLYSFESDGADVKVGNGENQRHFTAFFHVVGAQLDTKQADQFMGASHVSKYRKCRLCMELCTSCFCTAGRPVGRTSTNYHSRSTFRFPLPPATQTHIVHPQLSVLLVSWLWLFLLITFFG